MFLYLLHGEIASVDPHPRFVCVLVAQADPVAVSLIVVFLRVVVDEFLHLRHSVEDGTRPEAEVNEPCGQGGGSHLLLQAFHHHQICHHLLASDAAPFPTPPVVVIPRLFEQVTV